MSIWLGPKGKAYTGTGENSWLKRYIEHLTKKTKEELTASAAQHYAGTAFRHHAEDIEYDEAETVQSIVSSNIQEIEALEELLQKEKEAFKRDIQDVQENIQGEAEARAVSDATVLAEVRSLNLKNGSASGSLRSSGSVGNAGEDAVQLGKDCKATGVRSHAQNYGTIAAGVCQSARGKFNAEDKSDVYADIVGNGTSNIERSNAYTLDWNGNGWFAGDVTVGENKEKLATKSEYLTAIDTLFENHNVITDIGTFEGSEEELSAHLATFDEPGIYKFAFAESGSGWDMWGHGFMLVYDTGDDADEIVSITQIIIHPYYSSLLYKRDIYPDGTYQPFKAMYAPLDYSGKVSESYLPKPIASVFEDKIDKLWHGFDENGDGKVKFYVVVNSSELCNVIGFTPYLLLVSPTWNDSYGDYDTCQIKIQDGKTYKRYYTHLTPVEFGWTDWKCDMEEADTKKLDKDTIVTEASGNTLVLEENQDARLGETESLVLSMPESIGDWYKSTFSFQSGENATSLVYGYTPLDWKGDDVTTDGRFVPEPYSTYEVDVKNLGVNGIRARVDKIAGYTSVDVEGTVLSLPSSAGKALRDYKIYGNSVQDGEPTEETPVAIQSVGNYNEETGKYDVPISVRGKNCVNVEKMLKGEAWRRDAALNVNGYWHYPISGLEPNTTYTVSVTKNGFAGVNTGTEGYYVAISNTTEGWHTAGALVHYSGGAEVCRTSLTVTSSDEGKLYIAFYNPTDERLATFFEKCPNFMIELGDKATEYQPYIEPVTTTICLEEPLRKVGDVADYIDFKENSVVQQVEVLDDTGTRPIEESYAIMEEPRIWTYVWENSQINTNLYDNVITIDTDIQPSNVKATYFKKG